MMIIWDYNLNNRVGLYPDRISIRSHKKAYWVCGNHEERYHKTVDSVYTGGRCGYCDGKKVLVGFNDLWTTNPDSCLGLLDQTDGYKYTAGSGKKVWWVCHLGHRYLSIIGEVTKRGRGCPYCSNKKVLVGFNDLKTTHPLLVEQMEEPLQGYEITKGSSAKKYWWVCLEGHRRYLTPDSRKVDGRDCFQCSNSTTSEPERFLLDLIPNAEHQPKYPDTEGRNKFFIPDLFVPDHNLYIEYDGCRYHIREDKQDKDIRRTKILLSGGHRVVRIREHSKAYPLKNLPIKNENLLQVRVVYNKDMKHLEDIWTTILKWLNN